MFLEDRSSVDEKEEQFEYLASESGWKVRRLAENRDEMSEVAQIQAEAFHTPVALFDDVFFEFFKVFDCRFNYHWKYEKRREILLLSFK